MRKPPFRWPYYVLLMLLAACTATATPVAVEQVSHASVEFDVASIPDAQSQSLALGSDGALYLLYGQDHSLFVARSTDGGRTFSEPVLASGEMQAHVLPVERPAIAVHENSVGVAWLELAPNFSGATVWYARSEDEGDTFTVAQSVAVEPAGEVAMVQAAFDDSGNPLLAWLNGTRLKFARSDDRGVSFAESISIDGGACECCQPQTIVDGDQVHMVYRSREPGNEAGEIRDIVMIRSVDGGRTFEPATRVSDAHWYLPACPIAGPSLAVRGERFFVAWMDGRLEEPGTFSRGDVWFASSQDRGQTFSPNLRLPADESQHNTLPVLAIGPGGRIHIAWEAQTQGTREAFLYYTFSDDGGQTFAQPQAIADNSDPALGNPGKPTLVVDSNGRVTLAWLDRSGARIASWIDTK